MQQGKMYLFVGLFMALLQGGFVRRIKSGKEATYSLIGMLFIIPSFIVIGMASAIKQLYGGLVLYAFASATIVPCLTTIASSYGPSDQKGVALGIFRSIGALARALGPLFASIVFWKFGSTICYLGGAILLVIPFLGINKLRKLLFNYHDKNISTEPVNGSTAKLD
jgi:predicted MFS family arabinose efflux permease